MIVLKCDNLLFESQISGSCYTLVVYKLEDLKGTLGYEGKISCLFIGGNNSMVPSNISISFPSSVNISSIVKSTRELLLNSSNVLVLLLEEYIDGFRLESNVAGVAIMKK